LDKRGTRLVGDRCIAEAEVSRRREVKELKRYKNWQTT
jgi:hypothetical protein